MSRGLHLIVDCTDVPFNICVNDKLIYDTLLSIAQLNDINVITAARYRFGYDSPEGCTVFLMLDESHISVHTYAAENKVALDFFTCSESTEPEIIFEALKEKLDIKHFQLRKIDRFI